MNRHFFVGSYTQADFGSYSAEGKGIYTCTLDPSSGEMRVLHCAETTSNPTYVVLGREKKHLYTLETGKDATPSAHAYAVNDDFSLSQVNVQPLSGAGPCHLALDPSERFLALANYGSGNVVLLPVNEDGSLAPEVQSVQHEGSSVHSTRQEGPHAHATVFAPEGDTLLVADLGLDAVLRYRLDKRAGQLEPIDVAKTPAGAGPRHLVFHPSGDYVFVANELDSTLSLFRYKASELTRLETVSTLPEGDGTESYCAAIRIHPSGRNVYVSNRGHDSLAVFEFDAAEERLQLVQTASTGGRWPRDFALDAEHGLVLAANQETSNLVSLWLDEETGQLEPTGHSLGVGTPVCVALV